MKAGRELLIAPSYTNAEGARFTWTCDDEVVCREASYVFRRDKAGIYYLSLRVENDYGAAEDELRVRVDALEAPCITLIEPVGGFTVAADAELTIAPTVENGQTARFRWTIDGETVGEAAEYLFRRHECGDYEVTFSAANDDGEDSVSFTVKVLSPEQMPFSWEFPQTVYNVALGRTIRLKGWNPVNAFDAEYIWEVDGTEPTTRSAARIPLRSPRRRTARSDGHHAQQLCDPLANTVGQRLCCRRHLLPARRRREPGVDRPRLRVPARARTVGERLHVRPALHRHDDGRSVRLRAIALRHQLHDLAGSVGRLRRRRLRPQRRQQRRRSRPGHPRQSLLLPVGARRRLGRTGRERRREPNDTWYELAGSEYDSAETIYDYSVTYYQPTRAQAAVVWRDNRGGGGTIDHNAYWNPSDSYYQPWLPEGECTFYGTRLLDRSYVDASGQTVVPPYDWGYADNAGKSDYDGQFCLFRLSNARTFDGRPADLKYIDFVKIQTGQMGKTALLGETSTEVHHIVDYHLIDRETE